MGSKHGSFTQGAIATQFKETAHHARNASSVELGDVLVVGDFTWNSGAQRYAGLYNIDSGSFNGFPSNPPTLTKNAILWNGLLYINHRTGVSHWDVATQTWILDFNLTNTSCSFNPPLPMEIYNGELWVGDISNRVWSWNGSTLTFRQFLLGAPCANARVLHNVKGTLYAVNYQGGTPLKKWDGAAFVDAADDGGGGFFSVSAMHASYFDGVRHFIGGTNMFFTDNEGYNPGGAWALVYSTDDWHSWKEVDISSQATDGVYGMTAIGGGEYVTLHDPHSSGGTAPSIRKGTLTGGFSALGDQSPFFNINEGGWKAFVRAGQIYAIGQPSNIGPLIRYDPVGDAWENLAGFNNSSGKGGFSLAGTGFNV